MKMLILAFVALAMVSCGGKNGHDGAQGANGSDGKVIANSDNGGMTGGGGDTYVQEIDLLKLALRDYLKKNPIDGVPGDALAKAIETTKISFKDRLTLESDGQPRSAINYPDRSPPEIEFSRTDLDKIRAEKDQIIRLIFHEFLGILFGQGLMKVSDLPDYAISSQLNAAEIAREISIVSGQFVPTRLMKVDLSKQDLKCTNSDKGSDNFRVISCEANLQTELLVGFEALSPKCLENLKSAVNDTADDGGILKVVTFLKQTQDGRLNVSVSVTESDAGMTSPRSYTYADVQKMFKSCTLRILLYPDSAPANP